MAFQYEFEGEGSLYLGVGSSFLFEGEGSLYLGVGSSFLFEGSGSLKVGSMYLFGGAGSLYLGVGSPFRFNGAGSLYLGVGSPFRFAGIGALVITGSTHFNAGFGTSDPSTDEAEEGGLLISGFASLTVAVEMDDPDLTEWEPEVDFSATLSGITFESEDESDDTETEFEEEPTEEEYLEDEFALDVDDPDEEEI